MACGCFWRSGTTSVIFSILRGERRLYSFPRHNYIHAEPALFALNNYINAFASFSYYWSFHRILYIVIVIDLPFRKLECSDEAEFDQVTREP